MQKQTKILDGEKSALLDVLTAQLCDCKEGGRDPTQTIAQINKLINSKPINKNTDNEKTSYRKTV